MSCRGDRALYRRAGDQWSVSFTYQGADGQPVDLAGLAAKFAMQDAGGVDSLTGSTAGGELQIDDPATGQVRWVCPSTDTGALAVDGSRTEYLFALKLFDPLDEPGTERTIAVLNVVVLPEVVA